MSRRGHDAEAIAAMHGVSMGTVKASIDLVEEHRALVSNEMVDMRIAEVVLDLMDKNQKVLGEALSATKDVITGKGKLKKVPDHKTRLAALATQRELIETTRPKTPGVMLNQQFNNGLPGNGSGAGAPSFEALLRKKREARGMLNSQADEGIQDEMTHEEEIADEFKDLGGDDDGEEGGEDEGQE